MLRKTAFRGGQLQRQLDLSSTCRRYAQRTYSNTPKVSSPPLSSWATVDPTTLGNTTTYHVQNHVGGSWQDASSIEKRLMLPNPINSNGIPIFSIIDTSMEDVEPFIKSMANIPKSGLHNPLKNVDRYLLYGEISRQAGSALSTPEVAEFFAQAIMKCVPKSHGQAMAEVKVTADFLNNFAGDNVRFLARSFGVPGNHYGQQSVGYRWPYGAVALISPFNFPLEIPVLQLMGSLYMGNKPLLKPSHHGALVMEQFIRLLHACGMPPEDVDVMNANRTDAIQHILVGQSDVDIRMTQFTGSSRVAELLSEQTRGKVRIEDAGFDWKILGPDVGNKDDDIHLTLDYVAWQCDQDAYACSGQKCSAQSILFVHDNWAQHGFLEKLGDLASQRRLDDLTVGPALTHTTKDILDHSQAILQTIPGSHVLFGGKELDNHSIPDVYAAVEPTAVFVPLSEMVRTDTNFALCTREIFAPFQIITTYSDNDIDTILHALERMSHHLTAAVVSNDVPFQNKILSQSVNGTTYTGLRARTTGAPQNHWFGPAGDPRGAGIGTKEAIQLVWSCHREIIADAIIPSDWVRPNRPT